MIQETFEKQKAHHPALKRLPVSYRIQKLKELRKAIIRSEAEIQKAMGQDFRKSPEEASITEIFPVLTEIGIAIRNLKKWVKPVRARTPLVFFSSRSEFWYEPKGVVLIIGPFNYPFQLTMVPLISAISAGNCVMMKPSELTPHTSRRVKEILAEVFPPEEVSVFEGQADVAQALLELPFDHIFFTGSARVGKIVMAAAAKNLTPVTLELGGKSPAIVDPSANLHQAVERIIWGKFVNGGQTCIAPDYALVHESVRDSFIQKSIEVVQNLYGKDEAARRNNRDFPRIINPSHFQRIKKLIEGSIAAGAKLELGGEFNAEDSYIAPTILSLPNSGFPVMSEEIFGPVLPVLSYKSLDQACEFVRAGEKPLSLYLFSRDSAATNKVLSATSAGGTTVNNTLLHLANPYLPFGGVGNSGIGSYHGYFGFKTFSHERAVLKQGPFDTPRLFYPPYGPRTRKLVALAIKFLT